MNVAHDLDATMTALAVNAPEPSAASSPEAADGAADDQQAEAPSLGLDGMALGRVGRVVGFRASQDLELKLRELGFAEGDEVEVMAFGPLGGTPLSVRLNRTVFALRRTEAAAIVVSA